MEVSLEVGFEICLIREIRFAHRTHKAFATEVHFTDVTTAGLLVVILARA